MENLALGADLLRFGVTQRDAGAIGVGVDLFLLLRDWVFLHRDRLVSEGNSPT
jgi:hypothetical protein